MVGTFTADDTWAGDYTVTVRATNDCGDGAWANELSCTLGMQPVAFVLSNGGGYCEGGTGIELTLGGSEVDVDYELFFEDVTTGIIVAGTGSVISFGNQTDVGIYTCVGSAVICSQNMIGTPYIFTTTIPGAAATPTGPTAICAGTIADYSVSPIGNAETTVWVLSPAEAGVIVGEGSDISIEWDENYTGLAQLTAQGENSCGLGTVSDALEVNCSLAPTPVIVGLDLVCNEDEEEYETEDIAGNTYEWTVTGGVITTGAGTSIITVLWGEPGTGTVELTETAGDDCTGTADAITVTIDDCTGINDIAKNSMVIYPNPTSNVVNVKSETIIISIQLIDFTGKVVATKQVNANNYKYDVSNLQAGVYTIIVVTADANLIEKLIVE